jgi:putative endopeptidase
MKNFQKGVDKFVNVLNPQDDPYWDSSCFIINAYYFQERNELCLPVGILQPPFFSTEASFISNLAGIGTTIAHEISHAFDEDGHYFDEFGNLSPWWNSIEIELYKQKTQRIITIFDNEKYKGMYVDGENTLSENLADLGSISICLDVIRLEWVAKNVLNKEKQLEDLREFFIGYAKTWAFKDTLAKRKMAIDSDVHSPPEVRVNLILKQFDEFYEAFGFTKDDKGWIPPNERIDIWG